MAFWSVLGLILLAALVVAGLFGKQVKSVFTAQTSAMSGDTDGAAQSVKSGNLSSTMQDWEGPKSLPTNSPPIRFHEDSGGGEAQRSTAPLQKYTCVDFLTKEGWLAQYPRLERETSPWGEYFGMYLAAELSRPDREAHAAERPNPPNSAQDWKAAGLVCGGELVSLHPVAGTTNASRHELSLVYQVESAKRDHPTLLDKGSVTVQDQCAGEMEPEDLHRMLKLGAAKVADKIVHLTPSAATGTR